MDFPAWQVPLTHSVIQGLRTLVYDSTFSYGISSVGILPPEEKEHEGVPVEDFLRAMPRIGKYHSNSHFFTGDLIIFPH